MNARVLVVDDEKTFRVVAEAALVGEGLEVRTSASGGEALVAARAFAPDVVLLDRNLPDADGLSVMQRLLSDLPDPPAVILATAYAEVENAVNALKMGAFDYLPKPIQLAALVVTVRKALEGRRLRRRAEAFGGASRREVERRFCFGASEAMRRVVALAEKVAASPDTTVLVTGETGTGKEVVARLLHVRTPGRGDAPFVEMNCAAVPETLLESELFGHERGAFTDAKHARAGLLEQAEGGTLFLDEIGDMPLATQAKLLKVLETQSFRRLGGARDLGADVRFVAATHRDLEAEVAGGRFRLDLFHRLDVFRIAVPPLRERKDDVAPLARFFLADLAARAGKPIRDLTPAAVAKLLGYPFPGNVRELRNVIERGVILEDGDALSADAILLRARAEPHGPGADEAERPPTLAEVEKAYVERLLERARGNKSQVARWMEVSYPTVVKKIADYAIDVSRWKTSE
jgi:two-component system response regulator AtoC